MTHKFSDKFSFDSKERTVVSMRSGVLDYLGSEIGMEPADKVFKVLRTPATIANAAALMKGIGVTDEHIDMDMPAPKNGGTVLSSEAIDAHEEETDTTFAIKNTLELSDNLTEVAKKKKELSLGYFGDLEEHDVYDFEQKNIIPHHLAIVQAGRCGGMCSFIDRKPILNTEAEEMKIKFIDANGKVNMQQIIDVITALPEAIKNVPVDQVAKIVPQLMLLIESSKQVIPEEEASADQTVEGEVTDEESTEETTEEVSEDVETTDAETEEEVEMKDEEADEDKEEKEKSNFADSSEFKDAVIAQGKLFADEAIKTIEKARNFLDDKYNFEGKETNQIKRDALATQSSEKFTDAELDVAFKLLAKNSKYSHFVDGKAPVDKWDEAGEKSI